MAIQKKKSGLTAETLHQRWEGRFSVEQINEAIGKVGLDAVDEHSAQYVLDYLNAQIMPTTKAEPVQQTTKQEVVQSTVTPADAMRAAQEAALNYGAKFFSDIQQETIDRLDAEFKPLKDQIVNRTVQAGKQSLLGSVSQMVQSIEDMNNWSSTEMGKYKPLPGTDWLTVEAQAVPALPSAG